MIKTEATTRQKLIDTALELISQSSFGSVSVDDICRESGVKKGSFYHFFPSKVDLVLEAVDESFRTCKADYDDAFSPSRPPLDRFERLVRLVYEGQKEMAEQQGRVCGCPFTSLACEMGSQEPRIQEKFETNKRRMERYYENAIRDLIAEGVIDRDTDAHEKAKEIYAFLLGQTVIARIQNDLAPLGDDLRAGLWRLLGLEMDVRAAA